MTQDLWAKVSSQDVQRLQNILLRSGMNKSADDLKGMEKLFQARTASHRIRLMELFVRFQKDKKLAEKFPEFAPLLKDPERVLARIQMHDEGKISPDTQHAIQVLSWLQGIDHRNPIPNLPHHVDLDVRQLLKEAIHDVNQYEVKFKALSDFEKKIDTLTEVLDFYDTFKSRQDEIAKDGRQLKKPSEWLDVLPKDEDYDLKKRFSVYVETEDPLRFKSSFTQPSDIEKRLSDQDFHRQAVREHMKAHTQFKDEVKRARHRQALTRLATRTVSSVSAAAPVVARAAPVAGVALSAYSYLESPEDFKMRQFLDDLATGFTFTFETSACDTIGCADFFRQCKALIGYKGLDNYKEIMADKKFKNCLYKFFDQPLHEQSRLRQDGNLNRILLNYAPKIHYVSCQMRPTDESKKNISQYEMQFQVSFDTETTDVQVARFSQDRKAVTELVRWPHKEDVISYQSGRASDLKHCNIGHSCRQFPMSQVNSEKNYFWKDEAFTAIPSSLVDKLPSQSFIWAKQAAKVLDLQGSKMQDCCGDRSCRDYFLNQKEVLETTARMRHRELASKKSVGVDR